MTSRQKRKGDQAEREVCALLADELGVHARRAFGAGRGLDEGDVVGVPRSVVQVCAYSDVGRAVRDKLPGVELQRINARADFGWLFVRRRGGRYVAIPTDPFAVMRELIA